MMDAVQSIKTHKWIKALAITALALPLAGYAATVTQTVDSASSSTDWNAALWGDPASSPTAGNDYISVTNLRSATPTKIGAGDASAFVRFYDSSVAFTGDSLTMVDGTELLLKQAADEVADVNIIMDGGSLRLAADGVSANFASVTGTLHVASESWVGVSNPEGSTLTIGSAVTGSSVLNVGFGQASGIVLFSGDLSGFSGSFGVGGGDTSGTVDFGQNSNLANNVLQLETGLQDKINLTTDMSFLACNLGPDSSLPVGTYTAAEANDALYFLTGNFVDNGGSITVLTAPYGLPDPPPEGIVYQTSMAGSSDSWNGPAIWGGLTTVSSNDYISTTTGYAGANQVNYYTIEGRIRALSGDSFFDGQSLTMVDDTELLIKGEGSTHTCDNLILEGALVRYAPNSTSSATLAGGLTVASNSVVGLDNIGSCTLNIASTLHGSGNLSLRAGRVTHTIAISGDLSDYSGDLSIGGGKSALILDLNQNYDLPDVDMTMEDSTNYVHVLQLDDQTIKLSSFAFGSNSLAKGTAYTAAELESFFGATGQFTGTTGTLEVYNSDAVNPTITPDILSISVAGGTASLTWVSEEGVTYSILQNTDLVTPSWTPVKTGIVGAATNNTTDSVTVSGAGKTFYKVEGE